MTDEIYFFDSYAIIEISNGNPNYLKYKDCACILTKLNLFEIYYSFMRDCDEDLGEIYLNEYSKFVVDFDTETIMEAAKLRLKYKKDNLSMTDCMGYVLALRLGVKFLTGDKEFTNKENVEFVRK